LSDSDLNKYTQIEDVIQENNIYEIMFDNQSSKPINIIFKPSDFNEFVTAWHNTDSIQNDLNLVSLDNKVSVASMESIYV